MKLIKTSVVLGIVSAWSVVLGVGCSAAVEDSPEDDAAQDDGALTPKQAESVFDQVKTCDNLFKDRAAFRDPDLQEGVLRWKCGDVDGVTVSKCEDDLDKLARMRGNVDGDRQAALEACGDGFGQEYCEYNAVSKGLVVNSVKAGKTLKDADKVECVFTSVHSDVKGANTFAYQTELAGKIRPELSGATAAPEVRVAGMQQGVNSRGAADTLIDDCSQLAKGAGAEALAKNAERQVACYRAWSGASATEKTRLQKACKNVDLAVEANWEKTRLAAYTPDETTRDLAACTMVLSAKNGGVSWRNSDPTICARSYRATRECGVSFKRIGQIAPDFQGFSLQGWTSRDTLPPGCRFANVDGKPFGNIAICTPNPADVKTYRTQKKALQLLCRDKFGVNVAMQAPVGALADLTRANDTSPFCKAFVAGARKAQGVSGR